MYTAIIFVSIYGFVMYNNHIIHCTFMLLQLYLFKELGDANLAVAIGEH